MKRILIIIGAVIVIGAAFAGALYYAFPVPMTTYGGMGLNFLKTLSTPPGTVTVETNPAYNAAAAARAVTGSQRTRHGRMRRPATGRATTGH